jgi:hypothetical protein
MKGQEEYLMVCFMDSDYVIYHTAAIVHAVCEHVTDITAVQSPRVLLYAQKTENMNNRVQVLYILYIKFALISRKYINVGNEDWTTENYTTRF